MGCFSLGERCGSRKAGVSSTNRTTGNVAGVEQLSGEPQNESPADAGGSSGVSLVAHDEGLVLRWDHLKTSCSSHSYSLPGRSPAGVPRTGEVDKQTCLKLSALGRPCGGMWTRLNY